MDRAHERKNPARRAARRPLVKGQNRRGRRGSVFSIRITDEEKARLIAAQRRVNGPDKLGPFILYRALESIPANQNALPAIAELARVTRTRALGKRIILDLCAGSGAWSAPYVAAGYRVIRVTLPELDVRTYVPPKGVWGVLAAPPCEAFSLAVQGHKNHRRDFAKGLETVCACLRIIALARPRWWALENPTGLLSRWLGTPRDVFEPHQFGDPWTKRTALWGDFQLPKRGPFVKPVGPGPVCLICGSGSRKEPRCSRAEHRALTSPFVCSSVLQGEPMIERICMHCRGPAEFGVRASLLFFDEKTRLEIERRNIRPEHIFYCCLECADRHAAAIEALEKMTGKS